MDGKTHSVPRGTIRKTKSDNGLKDLDESKTRAIESVVLSTAVQLTAGRGATYAAFPVFRLHSAIQLLLSGWCSHTQRQHGRQGVDSLPPIGFPAPVDGKRTPSNRIRSTPPHRMEEAESYCRPS
jgi:hypothetical protein